MPSKLEQLQAQFRQRIDQQKEEKLSSIRIYNENQQRVLDRVSKSNGSNISGASCTGGNGNHVNGNNNVGLNELKKPAGSSISHPPALKHGGGSGVDRSRPLKPMTIKPTLLLKYDENSSGLGPEQLQAATARSTNLSGSGTMVLSSKPRATSASAVSNHSGVSRLASPQSKTSAQPATKVEVKKTGAGNKVISTTVKPNEIMKVTVETIKKATPPSSTGHSVTTTVKTTIHKRTITPIKPSPSARNGHSENGTKSSSPLVNTTPKSATTPVSRRVTPSPASSFKPSSAPAPTSTTRKATTPATKSAPPTDPNMAQCSICGRNFAKDRIEKHETICQKTSVKKRKPFDATKMRVKGTEAEQFVRRGVHKKEDPKLNKKSNWRSKHEEFINSIRQAKIVQKHLEAGGKLSDLPPPKPSENPDYVPCPHCGRKFNEGAAERHIPKCKNIVSNKKTPIKKK